MPEAERCRHDADPVSCPACYAEDITRAAAECAPARSLAEDLAELEATNPEVAAAAKAYDETVADLAHRARGRMTS